MRVSRCLLPADYLRTSSTISRSGSKWARPTRVAATPGRGTASAVGRSLTWSSQEGSNLTEQQVLVSSQNGQTLIRVEQSYSGLAAGWFGGIMGGVGGGVGFGLGGALSATLGLGASLLDGSLQGQVIGRHA